MLHTFGWINLGGIITPGFWKGCHIWGNYGEQNSRTVDHYQTENVKVLSQFTEILSRLPVWKLHKALLKKQLAKRPREWVRSSALLSLRGYQACLRRDLQLYKTLSKGCITTQKGRDALEKKWRYQDSCAAILQLKLKSKFRRAFRLQGQYLPMIMCFKIIVFLIMIDIPYIIDLDLCAFLKKLDRKYSAELLHGTYWPTDKKVMEESGNKVLAWPAT